MQGSVHDFDPATGAGSLLLDDGRRVPFGPQAFAASRLRLLRVGQRLTFDLDRTGPDGPSAHQLRLHGI